MKEHQSVSCFISFSFRNDRYFFARLHSCVSVKTASPYKDVLFISMTAWEHSLTSACDLHGDGLPVCWEIAGAHCLVRKESWQWDAILPERSVDMKAKRLKQHLTHIWTYADYRALFHTHIQLDGFPQTHLLTTRHHCRCGTDFFINKTSLV